MKTHCLRGHELTPDNSYQTFKNDKKNGRKCRECQRQQNRDSAREDRTGSHYRSRVTNQLRQRYGIKSLEERDAILVSQGGGCAVCGRTDCTWGKGFTGRWHIDHDHDKPGTHRGILCSECNHTLGRLRDDPAFIQKFIEYLKRF